MKKLQTSIKTLLSVVLLFSIISCDKDNHDDLRNIPELVQQSFTAKYPTATRVEWAKKGDFVVADFWQDQIETEAWFDGHGTWYMTECDIQITDLPDAVNDAFKQSSYALWKIDDLDLYERSGYDPIYIIEVEKGETDVVLQYTKTGTLLKELVNVDDDQLFLPTSPIEEGLKNFINENYPEARIIEIEREQNRIEVDVLHNNRLKEIIFDNSVKWIYSSWKIALTELPEEVTEAIQTHYSDNQIDEVNFVETPQQVYYLLELEPSDQEVKIAVDGTILP